jgi:hypothetical protein
MVCWMTFCSAQASLIRFQRLLIEAMYYVTPGESILGYFTGTSPASSLRYFSRFV